MKRLLCLLMVMAMLASLTACGLFTAPTTEPTTTAPTTTAPTPTPSGSVTTAPSDTEATAPVVPDTGIQMTEKFTWQDPEGLDFDTRYVVIYDANSALVASAAAYGVQASYSVVYAKDDAPVYACDFMICDTPENAQAVIAMYLAMGTTLTASEEDPCVVYAGMEGEVLEATILMLQMNGMLPDTKVSTYVSTYPAMMGGRLQE